MKIKYQHKKIAYPHCGDCKQPLSGNGSIVLPYGCKCGFWKYSIEKEEYVLIEKS